jgi:hypothetical protein
MPNEWEKIGDGIVDVVREGAGNILDASAEARAFLRERANRLAQLASLYPTASSAKRKELIADMEMVKQTMLNDAATLALQASDEAKATFSKILSTAFGTVIKILPAVI